MGQKMKSLLSVLAAFLIIAVIIFLVACSGVIVTDRSAKRGFENSVTWQGHRFIPCSGEYHEGKAIAKTSDGWTINEVEEDPAHTFIVLRSNLDQYLLVREDYAIPVSGAITAVVWNGEKITNNKFCNAVSEILSAAQTDFEYQTDGIFQLADGQHMRQVYVCYEGCPVATQWKGYMGTIDGNWVITTNISDEQRAADGSPMPYTVWCYTIPPEYHELLNKYVS